MENLLPQVERAIFQLYQDPDPANQKAADRWLQDLRNLPEAWHISWGLLQCQSVEVQNFGALMLRGKITGAWSEWPQDQYETLRLELFKAIARFSSGPKLVLIQLCRALVGFAFNTIPDFWPNTVVSMIHSLRRVMESVPDSKFSVAVIQLLTVLPEEFDDTSTKVVASKRGVLRRELQNGLQSVLSLLEEVLSSSEPNTIKIDAMKCCSSWVQFGLPLLEMLTLIDCLFRCLLEEELFTQACETLTDIVSHDNSIKYPKAVRKFLQRVLELRDFIRTKLEENDTEDCLALCKVVQSTADANMDMLIELSEDNAQDCEEAIEAVQMVLEFFCLPGCYPVDELCSEVTFHFWEDFLDRIATAEPTQCRFLLQFYSPSITSLMEVFPDKAQYPSEKEWEDSWSDDEQDNFMKYREDLCDLAEPLQRTMHIEYIQQLSTALSSLFNSSAPTWQSVESILFLLQGVASSITQQSSPLLQNVLSLFPRMPPHPTLIKTALSLLGYLSNWFKHHMDLLQAVLPMILGALTQPNLAPRAALAFRDVCGDCAEQLSPFVVQLIPACQAGLANPSLESRDCVRLVAAIGCVLSSMPVKDLVGPLESLVASQVQNLQALATEEPSEARKEQVEKELAVLSALCHHVYPTLLEGEQHPVVMLLVQLWPSLQRLITSWCTDQDVVESICICLNRAMRTVQEQYAPLLEGTVELIVKCYAAVRYPKLLDSATQLVELFGRESSCSQLISALLQQLHTLSLPLFQSALGDHPDTVQAFLGLMSAVLRHCPVLLLQVEGAAGDMFEIGLAALELPEQPTVNAAAVFFVDFIRLAESLEPVREVLSRQGYNLVQYSLQAIAGIAPRSYLSAFTDILGALNTHCVGFLSQWLEDLLSLEGFPSHHVTVVEKQLFKSTVLKEQANKRLLKERVKEFALMCRGFHGTLYAVETS